MKRTWVVASVLLGACSLLLVVPDGRASAHDDEGRPRAVRELFVPESWAGRWSLRFEHRRLDNGNLVGTEEVTDAICPGDRLGLSAFVARRRGHGHDHHHHGHPRDGGLRATCFGDTTDERLEVECSSQLAVADCRVDFRVAVQATRQLDALHGSSAWEVVRTTGDCAALLEGASLGETVEVSGLRLGPDAGACSAPPASLVEKLLSQPELAVLLPPPIDDLAARPEDRSVLLWWTPVERASAYKVYRARPGASYAFHARRTARHPHLRDHRVREGATYRYVVRWVDDDGRESPVSNEAIAGPRADGEGVRP